jgi:lysyl-tRNA synthetase class 2
MANTSLAPKNNHLPAWQPSATLANLQKRAQGLRRIREFFVSRDILEVDTPLLSHSTVTDPQLYSFATEYFPTLTAKPATFYLQTSPEFGMKRLLAAGSGSIYQICKAFRNGESGRNHNPEFTMLEWYRVGFSYQQLMQEVDEFLQHILQTLPAEYCSYQALFQQCCDLNPHVSTLAQLKQTAAHFNIELHEATQTIDRDTWLQLLMTHVIEPKLGLKKPTIVFDYPGSQAALAQVRQETEYTIAERFEVYIQGIELANGFHELSDAVEQQARFMKELEIRQALKLPTFPHDDYLIQALAHGLPACAGVALGIDRLIMLFCQATHIDEVIAFPLDRA